jgi:mono/diheme cytochrome c family protein
MAVSLTRNRSSAAALAVAGAALLAFATTGSAPAQELAPITFTTQQANAGGDAFRTNCAPCHGATLQGGDGPALAGEGAAILTRSVGSVYAFISENMPRNEPGTLPAAQYLSIVAFIARSNGFTAGPTPLPADPEVLNGIAFRQ